MFGADAAGPTLRAPRLEAACERAEHLRSYSYRTVKNILASAQDRLPFDAEASGDATPTHDNIRGAGYYAAIKVSQEIVRPLSRPDPWKSIGGPGGPQYPVGGGGDEYGVAM